MTIEKLTQLLENIISYTQETEWIEFKRNNKAPEEIGKKISWLSNTVNLIGREYWYLVYGVDDKTHDVVGTSVSFKDMKIWAEPFEAWLLQRLDPKADIRFYEFQYNNMPVVLIEIPKASYRPLQFNKRAWIRIDSVTKSLNDYPEKERKIRQHISNQKFEQQIALQDLTPDQIIEHIDYQSYFRLAKEILPETKTGIIEKLEQEGFISKNKYWSLDITNFWALLFAIDLKTFPGLKRKSVRVVIYKWINKITALKEQTWWKWYASWFTGLIEYIVDNSKSEEYYEKGLQESDVIPEIMIRELVANALIHQDLYETGTSPLIEIYDDRIEISNPWTPMIETQRFLDHPPKSRNEELAWFMKRVHICEERWSGIDKTIFACEKFGLPAPEFDAWEAYTRVVIFKKKEFSHLTRKEKISVVYRHTCWQYIQSSFMTNTSLRERFHLSKNKSQIISSIITEAVELGLIKQNDSENTSKKFTQYVPFRVK